MYTINAAQDGRSQLASKGIPHSAIVVVVQGVPHSAVIVVIRTIRHFQEGGGGHQIVCVVLCSEGVWVALHVLQFHGVG